MTEVLDPFSAATAVRPLGDGGYAAQLRPEWAVGEKPHGGYLLALLAQAACGEGLEPLGVSAQYLRPTRVGPVLIRVGELKKGKTVTVLRAVLEQRGQVCVDATLTTGTMPAAEPEWTDVPDIPVNPPDDAIDLSAWPKFGHLTRACDLRMDAATAAFINGGSGEPRYRMWAKPRDSRPDLLFGLVAGDLALPVTMNMGRFGWAPTVQLTALLRAHPANGWLRLSVDCRAVHGPWFDEDVLVIDSVGRVICQARQLALSP